MRITFRLKPGRDNDLIAWLEQLPDDPGRSYTIRQVLRGQVKGVAVVSTPEPLQVVSAKPTPLTPEQRVHTKRQDTVITDTIPQAAEIDLDSKLDSLF